MTNDEVQMPKLLTLLCHCEASFPFVIARLAKPAEAISEARGLPRTLRVLAMTGRGSSMKMKMVRLNSQVRKAFQGRSRGFTFVEVLVAIALIGIISVAILGALSTSSKVLSIADERTTAESLARRQMEYIKNQGYNAASVLNNNNPTYQKISDIPAGYSIWSVNRTGAVVTNIVGIPWDSQNKKPADKDSGLQKIALVIKHTDPANQVKVIYTFINNNLNWANGVQITLEGYKVDR